MGLLLWDGQGVATLAGWSETLVNSLFQQKPELGEGERFVAIRSGTVIF